MTTSLLDLLGLDAIASEIAARSATPAEALDRYRKTVLALGAVRNVTVLPIGRPATPSLSYVQNLLHHSTCRSIVATQCSSTDDALMVN